MGFAFEQAHTLLGNMATTYLTRAVCGDGQQREDSTHGWQLNGNESGLQ